MYNIREVQQTAKSNLYRLSLALHRPTKEGAFAFAKSRRVLQISSKDQKRADLIDSVLKISQFFDNSEIRGIIF